MSKTESGSDLIWETGSSTLVQKGIDSLRIYNTIQNGTKELDYKGERGNKYEHDTEVFIGI